MDLNGDGRTDILSGSYSRMEQDMAGLFQVLYGVEGGGFAPPVGLTGTDGELLIIPATEEKMTDKICTRPTAGDLNGDGNLDIVSGNFAGTFYVFLGEGKGRFQPTGEFLQSNGKRLSVPAHSDPFLVDWDGDGDLDLLSGSSQGGVYLATNHGTSRVAAFGRSEVLIDSSTVEGTHFGRGHLKGPQSSTRIWVDDLNLDGKLDILVGDSLTLNYPADGLDEATSRERFEAWTARQQEIMQMFSDQSEGEEMDAAQDLWQKHYEEMKSVVRQESTGFVWAYYQKSDPGTSIQQAGTR